MFSCPVHGRPLSAGRQICGAPVRGPLRASYGLGRRGKSTVRMAMVAPSVEYDVVKVDGTSEGVETLSLKVADQDKAKGLVHRYLVKVRRDMRQGSANTKTRAEVRGGGRKPFQQKGSGRARQGSIRSPLMVGGGVIFGPKPRDYSVKMNKKERRLAFGTALQSAAEDILVCEDLEGKFDGKTKALVQTLATMGVSPKEYSLIITNKKNEMLERAGKNVQRLQINRTSGISVYDVLRADKVIIEQSALKYIQDFYGPVSKPSGPVPVQQDSPAVDDAPASEGSSGEEQS